ncbi:MAG: histidine kinase, partial [Anaerolineae bacterium]|nr:histidine kinase [Anaerolineae bacterium]
ILVEDDGIGFATKQQLELSQLLADKHFGLVGMFERAAIIGADLAVASFSGEGTRVSVIWNASASSTDGTE